MKAQAGAQRMNNNRTCRAAIIEKPGTLVVRDVPLPQIGEYDALCKLLYGATCSGTDQHLIEGRFPWPVSYPTVLGHESIGQVTQIGAKVRNLRVGDLVTRVGMPPAADGAFSINWGGFAEYGVARDHWAMREDGVKPEAWRSYRVNQVLPPGTDAAAATMIITWRETLSYVTRMGISAGAKVLVVGSGGNGLSFVAHAANLGASLVVGIGSEQRRGIAMAAGAMAYLDYKALDLSKPASLDDFPAEAREGFDYIIDAVGKAETLNGVLGLVKPRGTVGIYGVDDYGRCTLVPQRARGTFTFYNGGYDEEETHDRVLALIQAGRLRADLWLDLRHPFALEEIDQAIEAVASRKMVKALVRLSR
jgi:threonine dehydrogenase-like Zn-dependent dehydrogenase